MGPVSPILGWRPQVLFPGAKALSTADVHQQGVMGSPAEGVTSPKMFKYSSKLMSRHRRELRLTIITKKDA